jgi:MoaA/NifB/PqqE/SkfB family radical SAM enzyme
MPDGVVRPCCTIHDWRLSESLGNIYKDSLESIINHPNMKKMRVDMMNGKYPYQCTRCKLADEKSPGVSLRHYSNQQLATPEFYEALSQTDACGFVDPKYFKLQYWDFRFSNICNFGCRMCNEANSSFIQLEKQGNKINLHSLDKNYDVWKNLVDSHLDECKIMYFVGGEPMLMKEHWYILEQLVEKKKFDVVLKYTTNASTLSYAGKNALDYWKHFNMVHINVSLDDVGERLEYQRHGAKWDTIIANMKKIHEFKTLINVSSALTAYSAFYYDEFVRWMNDNFTNVYLDINYCYGPQEYSPNALPLELREKIVEKWSKLHDDFTSGRLPNIVQMQKLPTAISNIMNFSSIRTEFTQEQLTHQFISATQKYDQMRNQNFRQVYPELQEYL